MDLREFILVDYRTLAMDLFQILMITLAFFMIVLEYRRSHNQNYLYPIFGFMILSIFFIVRIFLGGAIEYVGILYLPSVDLLLSIFESIGLLLVISFFSIVILNSGDISMRWGRVILMSIVSITLIVIALQTLDLIGGIDEWAIIIRPAFRLAILLIIASGLTQFLSAQKKHSAMILGLSSLAIAHLYFLFNYSPHPETELLGIIHPWPYIFNPIGYFLIMISVFMRINDEQMTLTEKLMRREKELETASSNLSRLNRLSTNLLRTTELKGIIRTILDSMNLDLGFKNTALFMLEKETASLRGYKISPLTGSPVSYPKISILEKSFAARCYLEAKPMFFGEPYAAADGVFLRDFDFSTRIAIIPILTKKEVECHELKKCKNKNCPVKSLDLSICWMMTSVDCPCNVTSDRDKIRDCMACPAFNLVGMVVLDNRNARLKADESILPFLETFANQAGMALQNAILVDDLSKESTLRTATLKNLPVGVVVLDPSGKIIEFNDAMCQITGYSEEETIGRLYSQVRITDDSASFYESVREYLNSMSTDIQSEIISHTVTVSGTVKRLNVRLRPILKNYKFNGLIIMVEDITSMKELERQLIRSESLASMGQLAMGIAHEINNPLAGVSGVLQVLEDRFAVDSSERKALGIARKDLKRASGIIKDLLTFAKQKAPEKKFIDINTMIEESFDFIPYQPGGENVKVLKDLDKNMPLVMVDPDLLQQVLTNLILNSLSATSSLNGVTAIISVFTWFDRKSIYIQIDDNGNGIPKENLGRVFEPFFTTKSSGRGTGLGLSLCDRIIADHDGIITVRSEPGDGTSFLLKLPRKNS